MKFYEFKDDVWINLSQIKRVTITKKLLIEFSDGTYMEEEDRNFINLFLEVVRANTFVLK
jgi:hypothetical protein